MRGKYDVSPTFFTLAAVDGFLQRYMADSFPEMRRGRWLQRWNPSPGFSVSGKPASGRSGEALSLQLDESL